MLIYKLFIIKIQEQYEEHLKIAFNYPEDKAFLENLKYYIVFLTKSQFNNYSNFIF